MQHGFLLARQLLARQTGTKQIIMITDGEPTAHIEPAWRRRSSTTRRCRRRSTPRCSEVMRCTKDGIRINTFMLDATRYLKHFIEKLTEMNRGRAFFTTPETLGDYVLVDFIEQKRAAAAPPAAAAAETAAPPCGSQKSGVPLAFGRAIRAMITPL